MTAVNEAKANKQLVSDFNIDQIENQSTHKTTLKLMKENNGPADVQA